MIEGQPIETRPPELESDKPAFPGQTRAPYQATAPFVVSVITDKLKSPWSLAFLPDGKMLVTEKPGALRIVDPTGALSEPIKNTPPVHYSGQVGLLDVVLSGTYATDRRILISYSEDVGDEKTNLALARATLDEAGGTLNDVKVIFRAYPAVPISVGANQGGRIAVAPDGSLFMTVGDRSKSPPWLVAQRLDTDLGKIIHITTDGAPAPGNPYIGKARARPEIWSIGHRSEEGLAFDPDGRLWEHENGPRGGDELNLITAGKNYGWPVVTHGIDYPGEKIDGGLTAKAGTEQPRYYWDPVIAPSGFAFYSGDLFPQWRGSAFIGGLRARFLDRVAISEGKVVNEEPLLVDQKSRIRDVRVGRDGALYVLTDDGKLLKLTPK
jgi:glucose/arabinose dehydrogenase